MARRKKPGRGGSAFVMLPHHLLKTEAWRALDTNARALYIELLQRYNGTNNGSIGLGGREAAAALNVSRNTAHRAFDALGLHGFVEVAQNSTFDQKRMSREWLLTDHKDDRNGTPASKSYRNWGAKKQNIVPCGSRIVPSESLSGKIIPRELTHSPTTEPVNAKLADQQSHVEATYISSHMHIGGDDRHVERGRRERQHTTNDDHALAPISPHSSDGPVQISDALATMLRKAQRRPIEPTKPKEGFVQW